jgi:hypothetical protein
VERRKQTLLTLYDSHGIPSWLYFRTYYSTICSINVTLEQYLNVDIPGAINEDHEEDTVRWYPSEDPDFTDEEEDEYRGPPLVQPEDPESDDTTSDDKHEEGSLLRTNCKDDSFVIWTPRQTQNGLFYNIRRPVNKAHQPVEK